MGLSLDEVLRKASTPTLNQQTARNNRFWETTHSFLQSELHTDPTVASSLVQILTLSDEFDDALLRCGLDPRNGRGREFILICGNSGADYVLLVADEEFPQTEGLHEERVVVGRSAFNRSLQRWVKLNQAYGNRARQALGKSGSSKITQQQTLQHKRELATQADFDDLSLSNATLLVVARPQMIPTQCPDPAWQVDAGTSYASVGCLVIHDDGRQGVTSVRHLFGSGSSAIGKTAVVNGSTGTVAEEDVISDSVFIEMSSRGTPANACGLSGFMSGVAPRMGGTAVFHGASSGTTTTGIQAIDPGVTLVSPFRQSRIYTPAVTSPGDSGAGLVEVPPQGKDEIIGFAHEVTAASALVSWSSWIWAESVFKALKVRPG